MRRRKSSTSSSDDHQDFLIITETEEGKLLQSEIQEVEDPLTFVNSVGSASLVEVEGKRFQVNHDSESHEEQEPRGTTVKKYEEKESRENEVHQKLHKESCESHLHPHDLDSFPDEDDDDVQREEEKNDFESTRIVIRGEETQDLCLRDCIRQSSCFFTKNNNKSQREDEMQETKEEGEQEDESPSSSMNNLHCNCNTNNKGMQRAVVNNNNNNNIMNKRDKDSSKSRLDSSKSHPFTCITFTLKREDAPLDVVPLLYFSSLTSSSVSSIVASKTTSNESRKTSSSFTSSTTSHMSSSCPSKLIMSCRGKVSKKPSSSSLNVRRNFYQQVLINFVLTFHCLTTIIPTTNASQYQSVVPTSYSRSDLVLCEEIFKSGYKLPCLCSKEVPHIPSPDPIAYPLVSNGSIAIICDGVSFFGDFPSLPFKARIHTFSQRNSFIQGLEPQLFTASGIPLIRVDFSRNRLRRLMERIFDGVESSLMELDLSHNLLGDQLNPIFSSNEFLHLRNLRSLDVSHNELRALDNNLLKGLKNLTVSIKFLSAIKWKHFCMKCKMECSCSFQSPITFLPHSAPLPI
jgi:hypothetical protein